MLDVERSMLTVRLRWVQCSLVSHLIKLAVFLARGDAHMKLHKIQDYLGRSYWLVGVASGHDSPGNRG
jgi:hypothetical protein